ncbi:MULTISPECIES: L7Ae/L30e/S12e/Gadd45 family ribosomal protein [Companilactobacillus]|jgi:ribosomal protein L7Ae-like RNA K-turn-binding protein|uniref:50S ribosomal protein L7 n=3 Tax=Companilactobacillus TaxID=2767879 RepID=A0A5B7SYP4_9LACO|nr:MULTISPECIES: ribosomal L7Ae/L30e/S12e/Gadd45 family protein [Companilactobacillus]AKP03740.1 50S ribosomal protein L7 [Companilactobacillus farciminis]AKS52045.1 50S ribosomal protein L7 [Companilactobacillus farciminis]KRK91420.1 ribosomal protein L7A family protein [Companilactobacillus futsaii JCM 17355]MDG5112956.1 ribosomal L7Ae/L30e/S12e/Gadd45 family protein [Companilactobacillus pabuli]QCX24543.1 50S ribosomal protein L7 [Companilactobacillus futsaii]
MKNFLNFLGIAVRARKFISGTELTINGMRSGEVKLVIMAQDCSARTKKDLHNKASYYNVPVIDTISSEELKTAIGKDRKVMGITDFGFAKRLKELMDN